MKVGCCNEARLHVVLLTIIVAVAAPSWHIFFERELPQAGLAAALCDRHA
jgi:hypothetical protein